MGDGMAFFNSWLWAIFAIAGLVMILTELILGVETGFDLVVVGSILVAAGLVTSPFDSWWITAVSAGVLCVAYFVVGRQYVHRIRRWRNEIKTGADAIIGESGTVIRPITRISNGSVKIRNEEWRARAEENIDNGEEITVVGVKGITLIVQRREEVT